MLAVYRETGRLLPRRDGPAREHCELRRVEIDHGALVFEVDEDVAALVRDRGLGPTVKWDSAGHGVRTCVNRGRVVARAVHREDALRRGVVDYRVRVLADGYLLQD